MLLGPAGRGRLQPGEGEGVRVVPGPGQRAREGHGLRVAVAGGPVDGGTARIRQAQDPGDLVEALARRVVQGVPEVQDRLADQVPDQEERGVAAGDDQHHARVGQRPVLQRVGGDVPGQVMDAVQRHPGRVRQRLRPGQAHLQRARQAGPGGDGDRVDLVQPQSGLVEGLPDDRVEGVQVRAGGDLGHDAAEAGVLVHARRHHVREQFAVPHDSRAGLVARRLDPQHHWSAHCSPPFSAHAPQLQTIGNKADGWIRSGAGSGPEVDRGLEAGLAGGAAEGGQDGRSREGDADEVGDGAAGVPAQGRGEVEGEVALELLGEGEAGQVREGAVGVEGEGPEGEVEEEAEEMAGDGAVEGEHDDLAAARGLREEAGEHAHEGAAEERDDPEERGHGDDDTRPRVDTEGSRACGGGHQARSVSSSGRAEATWATVR